MFKYLMLITFIFTSFEAKAFFNPLDAIRVIGRSASLVDNVGRGVDGANETADTMDASSELIEELSPEARISNRAERLVRRIERLENLLLEAGYTHDEIYEYLGEDSRNTKGTASTIRHLTRGVRIGKEIGKLGKSVSSIGDDEEETSEESLIMKELLLDQKEHDLNETERRIKDDLKFRKMLKSASSYRKSIQGLNSYFKAKFERFPTRIELYEYAKKVSKGITNFLLQSIFIVLIIRTAALLLGLGQPAAYGKLLKDSMMCGFLLISLPLLVDLTLQYSERLSEVTTIKKAPSFEKHTYFANPLIDEATIEVTGPSFIRLSLDFIKECFYFSGVYTFCIAISVVIALMPLFIFISIMFGLNIGVSVSFVALIGLSLFPTLWNLIGELGSMTFSNEAPSLPAKIIELTLLGLQFFVPLSLTKKIVQASGIGSSGLDGIHALKSKTRDFAVNIVTRGGSEYLKVQNKVKTPQEIKA